MVTKEEELALFALGILAVASFARARKEEKVELTEIEKRVMEKQKAIEQALEQGLEHAIGMPVEITGFVKPEEKEAIKAAEEERKSFEQSLKQLETIRKAIMEEAKKAPPRIRPKIVRYAGVVRKIERVERKEMEAAAARAAEQARIIEETIKSHLESAKELRERAETKRLLAKYEAVKPAEKKALEAEAIVASRLALAEERMARALMAW